MPNFQEESYSVYTLDNPLPTEILPQLNISPFYFVEITAVAPQYANYNQIIKFSIGSIDKGKNHVKNPGFEAFVVDPLGRVRGIYPDPAQNRSAANLIIGKRFNLLFQPPPSDQKIIGTWKLFLYLFDKSNSALVSYGIYEFKIGEDGEFQHLILVLIAGMTTALSVFLTYGMLRKLKLIERRKTMHPKNEQESEHNSSSK